ncbi:hypothetical protein ACTWQF_18730 [Streptomyces sp. 8N114]|uniref:hypothetical protein n=1 Tax=Streptomyces sp. 8N114 TaxID=3457419 RepID=UPI003FCFB799
MVALTTLCVWLRRVMTSRQSRTAHIRPAGIRARAYGQLQLEGDALAAHHNADTVRDQLAGGDYLPGGMTAFPVEIESPWASSAATRRCTGRTCTNGNRPA